MRIWKFGDNISTDIITPGRYSLNSDKKKIAKYCFFENRPEFTKKVKNGDIIVAGKNFACGSSRETAPIAIKTNGVKIIIAESFAPIFFRNAINIGILLLIVKSTKNIKEDHKLQISHKKNTIINITTGEFLRFQVFPDFIKKISDCGGIINFLKKNKI